MGHQNCHPITKTEPWDSAAQDGKKKCIHVVGPDFRDSFDDPPATEITEGEHLQSCDLKNKEQPRKTMKNCTRTVVMGHDGAIPDRIFCFPKDLP